MSENIITLDLHRKKSCLHGKFLLEESLGTVECGKCGQTINPFSALLDMAQKESRFAWRAKELALIEERVSKKSRVKCKHCHKMTDVKP